MSGFWDDPQHWPGDGSWPRVPGESIEGTVTRMAVETGTYGRLSLCVEFDSDGRKRWCNARLWRTFADARADVGDRVRVTRMPDEPRGDGQRPATNWRVERLQPARTRTLPATQADGPSW